MQHEPSLQSRVRYYSNVSTVYVLTLLFAWLAIHPAVFSGPSQSVAFANTHAVLPSPSKPLVAGKPVRIVIPDSGVDLPIDEGYYDAESGSWTLSGLRAQYAVISSLANDTAGNTFIYGHNNNNVFGALRHVTPTAGATALIYTDNGHIFAYKFKAVRSLTPDDTSVLDYQGPPILTILTCTGSVDEWRTMFTFAFDKVAQ